MHDRAIRLQPARANKNLNLFIISMIYFVSDLHLGTPTYAASRERELYFLQWLKDIGKDATGLYIVGDLFDFWFEYKHVVPKGFVRILGQLAQMSDSGLPITFFTGNHDLWMSGYFEQELGIQVQHSPLIADIGGKRFFIGHGDGLGPNDKGYKLMKRYLFLNPICRFMLQWLHPDIGVGMANYFSQRSRQHTGHEDEVFWGNEQEWLYAYAKRKLETAHYDYFIFGHRHLPLNIRLNEQSRYINLGDWLKYFTYAVFDGYDITLKCYKKIS